MRTSKLPFFIPSLIILNFFFAEKEAIWWNWNESHFERKILPFKSHVYEE